ncbi:unnamed protein product [Albugo candida]|uniref:Uncharacterized protein n=1 Tax=Albugo candida TaxID=65357 RepID=A0A024FV41_9STRA|nr:unnamed protein product [Albugo candida]|eukprot:CCI10504.1 unnamed protein product [Albugo candida]
MCTYKTRNKFPIFAYSRGSIFRCKGSQIIAYDKSIPQKSEKNGPVINSVDVLTYSNMYDPLHYLNLVQQLSSMLCPNAKSIEGEKKMRYVAKGFPYRTVVITYMKERIQK